MNYRFTLAIIAAISALAGFLFGYDTGVINGTQYYFTQFFHLDSAMQGWVVGSALVGCFIGAVIAGKISHHWGRKNSLILSAILFCISAWWSGLPSFLPQTADMLVVARILGGLGIGIASMNAPTYIAEISPADKRGKMVTYYQLAIVSGFFLVFLVTYFISKSFGHADNLAVGWRYMFWTELVPSILFLVSLFFVPKSPRWLMLKGRENEAIQVLTQLHGREEAEKELVELRNYVTSYYADRQIKVNIFAKGVFGIIVIGTVLSVLQQFTGINAVLYYGADIFAKALHFGPNDVMSQQVILAAVNFIFTFVAMYTVDKIGRKPLIYIGSVGMLIGFLLLGITLKTNDVGILSLIGVLVFIGSFAMSMGPVVWVVLSEMFPNNIRSIAMSTAVAAQWAANYVVSQSFPIVVNSHLNQSPQWNGSIPYFIFSAFIILIIVFTWRYLPETKGKSLEQLDEMWKNVK